MMLLYKPLKRLRTMTLAWHPLFTIASLLKLTRLAKLLPKEIKILASVDTVDFFCIQI